MQEHLTEGFNDEESDSVETTLNTTLHWTYQQNSWTWASNSANARNKPSKSSWAYEERFILSTFKAINQQEPFDKHSLHKFIL